MSHVSAPLRLHSHVSNTCIVLLNDGTWGRVRSEGSSGAATQRSGSDVLWGVCLTDRARGFGAGGAVGVTGLGRKMHKVDLDLVGSRSMLQLVRVDVLYHKKSEAYTNLKIDYSRV